MCVSNIFRNEYFTGGESLGFISRPCEENTEVMIAIRILRTPR